MLIAKSVISLPAEVALVCRPQYHEISLSHCLLLQTHLHQLLNLSHAKVQCATPFYCITGKIESIGAHLSSGSALITYHGIISLWNM